MYFNEKRFRGLLLWLAGFAVGTATAQDWKPQRPVRIVVMSTPSSGPDILARMLAPKFTESFNQQIVVDNRAGASGIIGAEIAAKAPPEIGRAHV